MIDFLELQRLKDFLKISQLRDFRYQVVLIEEFPETKTIEKAAQNYNDLSAENHDCLIRQSMQFGPFDFLPKCSASSKKQIG